MKTRHEKLTHLLLNALCVFVVTSSVSVLAQAPGEAEAFAAIKLATNPTTKLAAAEDFVTRFPESKWRLEAAETIAGEIVKVKNGSVALALLERARAVFTSDQELEILKPVTLEVYAMANRADDAFALAAEMLSRNPTDIMVLVRMTLTGTEETRKKNRKYTDVSLQYGLKAIEMLETNQKPDGMNDEAWTLQKGNLSELYQQTAILYLAANNTREAKARLARATMLSPLDPANFALLARVINADYLTRLEAYEVMPQGSPKRDEQQKLDAILDEMIDAYARAAGLATGRAEYQSLLQQVIPDLTAYYKQRNKQSIKGLQQLINRYRPPLDR